ncbi:hypothetical protein KC19_2G168100 [Ceratodon purpureus]|uniref:Uncharacterized protein n=1 Tax=Ceratodon purpureus TaxID=3225 RepID=A0A8T0IW98_CERPU|nr:hypothetical protein KC19_2G168100 [Ceratodon purpureus]
MYLCNSQLNIWAVGLNVSLTVLCRCSHNVWHHCVCNILPWTRVFWLFPVQEVFYPLAL